MKRTRFLVFILILSALGLSACGAIAITPGAGSVTAAALPVAFIGIVDSMVGDQWVISGTTVTVDPDVIQNGPFAVGDQVKVEGIVGTDGSFTVTRVEAPTPQDVSTLSPFGNENTNEANSNDANVNDDNSNTNLNDNGANINDDNGNTNLNDNGANTNDDNGNDDNSNDSNTNDDNGGGNSNDDNGSNSNDDDGGNSNDDDNSGGGNDDDDRDDNDNDD